MLSADGEYVTFVNEVQLDKPVEVQYSCDDYNYDDNGVSLINL